jgi:hypothetical protein
MRIGGAAVFLAIVACTPPAAATTLSASGKAVAYAMPAFAAGLTLYKKDPKGFAQLLVVTGLTYGTAYGLKQLVRQRRPYQDRLDHSTGWDSFPSTTSAISSAPSQFVWRRYGWEWGLPMFVISKYPGYTLSKSKQNRLWDGLATMAISWSYNRLLTTRYKPDKNRGFYSSLDGGDDGGVYLQLGYRW